MAETHLPHQTLRKLLSLYELTLAYYGRAAKVVAKY